MSKVTFGTASAPVSRTNTIDRGRMHMSPADEGQVSPMNSSNSGGTRVDPDQIEMQSHPFVEPPQPRTARFGTTSAPSSPGQRLHDPMEDAMPTGILKQSATAEDIPMSGSAAPSFVDGQPRHHHHHHHRSGHNTPSWNPDAYFSGVYGRPLNHQNAAHSKPVFSLARPLPTREQRDAQKAYRQQVRGAVGPGGPHQHAAGHHSAASSRHHLAQQPGPAMGPGAHHLPYYGGVQPLPGQYGSRAPSIHNSHERDELMTMLRQLVKEQQGGKAAERDDVRDDGTSYAKQENGAADGEMSKAQRRSANAERRDSVSTSTSGDSTYSSEDDEADFPNPWARFRHLMREPFAEFLGTFLLIIFGTGVSLQYFLSQSPDVADSPRGTYLSVSFGWGIGVAMGVWAAGGISGGHINPVVTICLALFRGFPWKKVPGYILAQILGSMTAAGVNYALYRRAISLFEGNGARTIAGTAGLFSTYPLNYMTPANAWFQEFVDTAILMIIVLAISDSNNASPPDGLNPLVLFLLITGLGAAMGMQTAYCLNPARDLGPRLVTWFAGYGRDVWNFRSQYWLHTPVIATICGGIFGSFLYDAMVYTGSESPLNRKWAFPWGKQKRSEFGPASKEKMPVGQTPPDNTETA